MDAEDVPGIDLLLHPQDIIEGPLLDIRVLQGRADQPVLDR